MIDSRSKGARGEYLVRDFLREATGLRFERVPASGALEYLKGDIYIPGEKNKYCIEVKNYEESPLTDKMFTQERTNRIAVWWHKLIDQAGKGGQEPLLFFKYNRSKIFVITSDAPQHAEKYMYISWLDCYILLAEEWLREEQISFLKE